MRHGGNTGCQGSGNLEKNTRHKRYSYYNPDRTSPTGILFTKACELLEKTPGTLNICLSKRTRENKTIIKQTKEKRIININTNEHHKTTSSALEHKQ